MTPEPLMPLNKPWIRRGAATGLAILIVGLSLSSYLAIIGYTIWESGRYGLANTILYGLDGALTFPSHLVAGLRGGGSGGGEDGIPVRVLSILGAALFWGAGTSAVTFLKTRSKPAYWIAITAMLGMTLWSVAAGYLSIYRPG